ncbi:hypothetical protein ACNFH5_11665 [Pseudomonas sp. NY15435]|uniref:hypothetical protein n=1 Tax=Pseudomonas sp. NY15435 TaxID=3400358 RepID=UPI003A884CAD
MTELYCGHNPGTSPDQVKKPSFKRGHLTLISTSVLAGRAGGLAYACPGLFMLEPFLGPIAEDQRQARPNASFITWLAGVFAPHGVSQPARAQ